MKKIHTPLPDRSVLEPPPVVVAVAGPPKVGKTLLIQCIVKNFTRTSVTNIKGPVTVVSGKAYKEVYIFRTLTVLRDEVGPLKLNA